MSELATDVKEVTQAQPPEKKKKKRKLKKTPKYFINFIVKLAVVCIAGYLLLTYVFGIFLRHGNDMFPAIRDGDLAITYKLDPLLVNECVVYKTEKGVDFGRVVAKAGDEVVISEDGSLMVNGITPSEQIFYPTLPSEAGDITYPYVVPENSVFVLHDYRDYSTDSRQYGAIQLSEVQGKIIFIIRRRGF